VDYEFELQGLCFVADRDKARANVARHGIEFEQAAQVFFDPFFRMIDASGETESREAAVGYDFIGRLLFVVHIEIEGEAIRLISARRATSQEREEHDS
jgi:uncharacterized DUF497 family protein